VFCKAEENRFGSMPPLAGVPYCRPGIHGVAPTVRQQGTPARGSHCTCMFRRHFSFQAPPCARRARVMMLVMQCRENRFSRVPPRVAGILLPAWNPRSGSDSPPARYPPPGAPLCKEAPGSGYDPGSPLPSTTSAGRVLWVESHSDAFATCCWACEALRTSNCLRTYLPAVFDV
jgi:hypothetical protein